MKKVILKNEKGEVIRTFNSAYEASRAFDVSHETIRRATLGYKTKFKDKGLFFELGEEKQERYNKRKRVVVVRNGEIKVYNTQTKLAQELGVTFSTVNNYAHGRTQPKGFRVYDYDEYVKLYGEPNKPKKEIIKKKEIMYFVNVLVGLVNGTLVDSATYKIGSNELTYSREKQALLLNDKVIYTRQRMLDEVEVEYPLLTENEKDFLKNLLVAFKDIKGIRKCNGIILGTEFIRIETNIPVENVDLPTFKENKYYKSLEQNRLYSLDELGL